MNSCSLKFIKRDKILRSISGNENVIEMFRGGNEVKHMINVFNRRQSTTVSRLETELKIELLRSN